MFFPLRFREFSSRWMSGVVICVEEVAGAPPGAPPTNSTPEIFPSGRGTDAPWSGLLPSLASVPVTPFLLESTMTGIPSSVQDLLEKLITYSFNDLLLLLSMLVVLLSRGWPSWRDWSLFVPRPAKGSYKLPVEGIPPTPGGIIGPVFGTLAPATELFFFVTWMHWGSCCQEQVLLPND